MTVEIGNLNGTDRIPIRLRVGIFLSEGESAADGSQPEEGLQK